VFLGLPPSAPADWLHWTRLCCLMWSWSCPFGCHGRVRDGAPPPLGPPAAAASWCCCHAVHIRTCAWLREAVLWGSLLQGRSAWLMCAQGQMVQVRSAAAAAAAAAAAGSGSRAQRRRLHPEAHRK
jgi:hypothetical protein